MKPLVVEPPPLAVGMKLYVAVDDRSRDDKATVSIHVCEVVSVGSKRVKVKGIDRARTGLAFGCATNLTHESAARYGRSEVEALMLLAKGCSDRIRHRREEIEHFEEVGKRIDGLLRGDTCVVCGEGLTATVHIPGLRRSGHVFQPARREP